MQKPPEPDQIIDPAICPLRPQKGNQSLCVLGERSVQAVFWLRRQQTPVICAHGIPQCQFPAAPGILDRPARQNAPCLVRKILAVTIRDHLARRAAED